MKPVRFLVTILCLVASTTAWASPVKVTHDIRSGGPSQIKAEGVLKASPEDLWKQATRFNEFDQFMPRVLKSFFISESGVKALQDAGTKNANKLRSVAKQYKISVPRQEGKKWEGLVFLSRYDDHADPGGKVPQWVTRLGATQTIPEMFKSVEKLAQMQE